MSEEKRNSYEERQAARKARLEAAAEKARAEAHRVSNEARQMAEVIPFGQPILVGHHSERRDRNYRDRIWNKQGKAYELFEKANALEQRAEGVGNGGISSDDPDAIAKLTEQIEERKQVQALMRDANKVIRKHTDNPADCTAHLVALGMTETQAANVLTPNVFGNIGFERFQLSNNNASIKRIEQRINELEREAQRPEAKPVERHDGITTGEMDDRICIWFPEKPSADVRQILKRNGFKFSPTRRNGWVRLNNASGRAAVEYVLKQLS